MKEAVHCYICQIVCLLCLILLISNPAGAQTPQHYNYNFVQFGNAFPFNVALGKKVQILFRPGDFNQPSPAPSGHISSVSFLIHLVLGPFTYSDFTIRMGRTDITDFSSGVFYTGPLDTVYHRASVMLSSPAGQWMTIQLDRTFEYDTAQSLVIEIQQCGASGASGFSMASSFLFGGRRNVSLGGTICPFDAAATDGNLPHMGITLGPPTGTSNHVIEIPDSYKLFQNFPNPFNPSTTINYSVPEAGIVELNVFDALGRKVATLVNDYKQTGNYSVDFNASALPSGIYYYEILSDEFRDRKKMTLIK
jgi:hypothetical protein